VATTTMRLVATAFLEVIGTWWDAQKQSSGRASVVSRSAGPGSVTTADENSVRKACSLDLALLRSCPEPIYGETPMPFAAVGGIL
jgi:hypothetical protein